MRGVCARVEAVGEGPEEQRFDEAEDGLDDAADGHDAHVRRDAVDGAVPGAEVHNQRLSRTIAGFTIKFVLAGSYSFKTK